MVLAMRVLTAITRVVGRLLVVIVSIAVLDEIARGRSVGAEGFLPFSLLDALRRALAEQPWTVAVVAVVLLVLNLDAIQFVLYSLANAPGRSYIRSQIPGGTSRVALSAIRRALAATAAQVPEIARARVRVMRIGRNRYRVHVRYLARDVRQAGSAAEHLRLVLKKRFAELVVLDRGDRVDFDLDLAGIVRVDGTPVPVKELPAPRDPVSEPETFRGPVYPVGGEIN